MTTYASVCSGVESASLAWEPLGMRPLWFSEVEPFPSAVLAHHWPLVPNWGDMTNLRHLMAEGLIEAPDVLVAGTPCQSFSVAGLRKGLTDERGNLTLELVKLANATPRTTVVWENVPGVLSSKDNAFGCFLGALAGEDGPLEPPGAKWTNAGYVLGPKRAIAWRVLDAQYFGVAQRRRRVFLVASPLDGPDPREILFEREGVRRDSPPSREAGAVPAALTAGGSHWDDPSNPHPPLTQSFNTGGIGASNQEVFSQRGSGIVTHPSGAANTLTARMAKGVNSDLNEGQSIVYGLTGDTTPKFAEELCPTIRAEQGGEGRCVIHGAQDPIIQKDVAFPVGRNGGLESVFAFTSKDYGGDASVEIAPTLRASGHSGSHANGGTPPAICATGEISHTLKARGFDGSEDGTGRARPSWLFKNVRSARTR